MTPAEQATLERDGVLYVPSQYGEPTPITLKLIEDGANHHVLTGRIPIQLPGAPAARPGRSGRAVGTRAADRGTGGDARMHALSW